MNLDLRGDIRSEFGFSAGTGASSGPLPASRFGSQEQGRRLLLRKALRQALRQRTGRDFPEIMDLRRPPPLRWGGIYISVSHARGMGGFVLSRSRPIGFDIEQTSRFDKYQPSESEALNSSESGPSRMRGQINRYSGAARAGISKEAGSEEERKFRCPPSLGFGQISHEIPDKAKNLQKKICGCKEEAFVEMSRLWCLKEAGVKALSSLKMREGECPKRALPEKLFLKNIFVRQAAAEIFYLSFGRKVCGRGAAFRDSPFTAAFAAFDSSGFV